MMLIRLSLKPFGSVKYQIRRLATQANSSLSPHNFSDVVIIGGGPAGLSLGAALTKTTSLKVTLLEGGSLSKVKQLPVNAPNNRVISLTPQSIQFLTNIGAWDYIAQERIKNYNHITAYDGVSGSKVQFDRPEIATMIEIQNIQAALLNFIESNNSGRFDVRDESKVNKISLAENGWPVVELENGDHVTSRVLIGADGANSPVRKFAGIESRGWEYNKWGVVATFELEYEDFKSHAFQRFLPTGPIALLPLYDKFVSIVWSTTPEISKWLVSLDSKDFVSMVNAAFTLDTSDLNYLYQNDNANIQEEVNWRRSVMKDLDNYPPEVLSLIDKSRARFPMKMKHADTYVGDRIALVGDAAHSTHPLAGQGLNMGIGDAESLAKSLSIASKRGLDIGSELALQPYWSERYPQNHVLLGVVDKLHKLYTTDFPPVVALRSIGLDAVNNLPWIKQFFINNVSGKN